MRRSLEPSAVFLLALAARLHGLGAKPLWLDEVLTQARAARPIAGVIGNSLRNHHLPTFFLMEHALIRFGADGAAALRAIPAFAGAACAMLVFMIARTLGGRAAAWLAGLLMAFAPLQVAFGQEARSYTLMTALILLALLGLIRLAQRPEDAARPLTDRAAPRGAWAAYGFGTLGALLVLGDALPWLVAANVAMAAAILPRAEPRWRLLLNWGLVHAGILAVALPGYLAMLAAVHDRVMSGFAWIPPLSARGAWADAASLYGLRDATMVTMRLLPSPLFVLAPLVFLLAGLGAWRLRKQPSALQVLAIGFLGLPVSLALISLIHPVLLPRYLLWSVGPFFVLAGCGIEALAHRMRGPVLTAAALLLVLNLLPYYRAETKPRWDIAASMLGPRLDPGDLLLVSDSAAPFMLNYDYPDPWTATRHAAKAKAALAGGHRVWAVYGPAGQGRQPARAAFFATAAKLGGKAFSTFAAGREIVIEQIDPRQSGAVIACADETGCH